MGWDRGGWGAVEGPGEKQATENPPVSLPAEKQRGAWHLVRTSKADEEKKGWLLFKSQDNEARATGSIIEERSDSALTGRTMEQIAGARDKVWHSNRAARSTESFQKKRAPPAPRRDA